MRLASEHLASGGPALLDAMGPATIHGLRWHHSRPPIQGLEFEISGLIKQMTVKKKKIAFATSEGELQTSHGGISLLVITAVLMWVSIMKTWGLL